MANTRLIIGTGQSAVTVYGADIVNISTSMSASIDGGTVAVDVLRTVVLASETSPNWAQLGHGTPIAYYEGTDLFGRFYVSGVFRVSKNQYQITCVSALGLLDEIKHVGGIYGGTAFQSVLAEIIGGAFSYSVDPTVATWMVGGWLPYDTARANLHRLLLALGINLLKDANGNPHFGLLDSTNSITVDDDDVYMGGEVGQFQPATSVAVTERQYLRLEAELDILYDSSDGSTGDSASLVVFDTPHYGLQASPGLTILAQGDNYARVQGVGTLTGIPYTVVERVVRLESDAVTQTDKEISVKDDGLINPYNSARVAQRLLDYHSSVRTIQGRLRLQPGSGIRPGKSLSMSDAFGDPIRAMLAKMNMTASATVAAKFEAVVGYQSGQSGNTYTDRVMLTSGQTWEAPTGHLRIILIGGGQGGQGGYNGERGAGGREDPVYGSVAHPMYYISSTVEPLLVETYREDLTSGGAGGAGGSGGSSGNVLVLDVDVLPGEELTFTIGAGGSGGAVGGGMGSAGTATTVSSDTIGTRSTAEGAPSNIGIWDPLGTGQTYAAPGASGTPGGAGGASTVTQPRGWDGGDGADGEGVGANTGGAGGAGATAENTEQGSDAGASGGGGGGAAMGGNGSVGTDGTCLGGAGYLSYTVTGGNGGNGGNAQAAGSATYGCGGQGGNGGGGGGNAGGCYVYGSSALSGSTLTPGQPGLGGRGSTGGTGGAGCVIILWDRYGRTAVRTKPGPQTVTVSQSVKASAASVQATAMESGVESTASASVSAKSGASARIVYEVVFGGKIEAGAVAAAKAHPRASYTVMSETAEAGAVAGAKAVVMDGVTWQDSVEGGVVNGMKAVADESTVHRTVVESGIVAPAVVDVAELSTVHDCSVDPETADPVMAAMSAATVHSASASVSKVLSTLDIEAGAGVVDAAKVEPSHVSPIKTALKEAMVTVTSIAAALWNRWAWMEGDTLCIDQEFGGASQTGGVLAVD